MPTNFRPVLGDLTVRPFVMENGDAPEGHNGPPSNVVGIVGRDDFAKG
jgi:hypothetical protein